jgi:hypothetical protein
MLFTLITSKKLFLCKEKKKTRNLYLFLFAVFRAREKLEEIRKKRAEEEKMVRYTILLRNVQ